MVLGTWNAATPVIGINYQTDLRILGLHFTKTIRSSARESWAKVTRNIMTPAHETYHRDLSLNQRIQYVNVRVYLLAKAWYTAQILPPPEDIIRQINTAVSWYVWQGAIFHVPMSTLYKPKEMGGWNLINVAAKCRTLLMCRAEEMGRKKGSPTERWLRRWNLMRPSQNPPNANNRLKNLQYLQQLGLDSAYMQPRGPAEKEGSYRRRIYKVMATLLQATPNGMEMRIIKKWQNKLEESMGKPLACPGAGIN
jgi:hypothetical protein